ncbi:helix-turn-helix domain-containing protein [Paraferrimonas sp. SM1919]|uniref:helix-turn-helix domain-containing protein n=1 Tax=Paraferrimonas sp. SM1919 TaxID=2662263 RepID=UPI0013D0D8E3|nr:helix-turn-helix domain-containing protein [Paraferrimonas sp. SM1919]
MNPQLISPKEAAKKLNLEVQTLAAWRTSGRYNLPFIKIGGRIQYDLNDINNFINDRRYLSTSAAYDFE